MMPAVDTLACLTIYNILYERKVQWHSPGALCGWRSVATARAIAKRRRIYRRGTAGDELMIEERDIGVAMRDGTRLAVDVYRPDTPGKYPVLYASALHNKDIQGPDIADILPPQPAHAPLWFGPIEAGDTRRFIANGYVH